MRDKRSRWRYLGLKVMIGLGGLTLLFSVIDMALPGLVPAWLRLLVGWGTSGVGIILALFYGIQWFRLNREIKQLRHQMKQPHRRGDWLVIPNGKEDDPWG